MNTSKFLKKSLAMLLAVMLVVAMIPMGASAAEKPLFVNDGNVVSIAAANGTLTGSGASFTDALTYEKTAETITVATAKASQKVWYKVDDGDVAMSADGTIPFSSLTAGASSKAVFFVAASDYDAENAEKNTKSKDYTVTVAVAAVSSSTEVKEASVTLGGLTVKGSVNNTSRTISFQLPWGYTAAASVDVKMANPVLPGTEAVACTVSNDQILVTAQDGRTAYYTIVAEEAACLSSLSIGGVKAVANKDDATKLTVTLPEGTELPADLAVSFQVAGKATAKIKANGAAGDGAAVKTGGKVSINNGKYDLTFTSETLGTKTYEVTVSTAANKDSSIKDFTVKAGAYDEKGTIKGDQLSVVLSSKTTDTDLQAAKPKFTVAAGATVAIDDTPFDNDGIDTADLTNTVTVKVTAADGDSVSYYQLTATKAKDTVDDPKITAASLTYVGDDGKDVKVTGAVSDADKTITFSNLPYSAADTLIQGATYTIAKTSYTNTDLDTAKAAFTFAGPNKVSATADSGTKTTYTFVFKKAAAKTGKELSNLTVTTAATGDKADAKNTYKLAVSGGKITGTLPYSVYNNGSATLVYQYTLSEGAKLYNVTGTNVGTEVASGFYPEDDEDLFTDNAPKTGATVAVSYLKADPANKYVVLDEYAVVEMAKAGAPVAVADLEKAPYKGHATVLSATVTSAPASKEYVLKSIKNEDGTVTATISNGVVTFSVPGSASTVTVDIVASDYATVLIGGDQLTGDALKGVEFTVDKTDPEKPVLKYKGAAVTSISVKSEYGETNPYAVSGVNVRALETSAALASVKVNGAKATISGRNVTVQLPVGTDLTAVTVEATAQSKMAAVVVSGDTGDDDEDGNDLYDVSEPITITVTSEDTETVWVYTLTANANVEFVDVDPNKWYAEYVYAAAGAGIVLGTTPTTYSPNNNIKRGDFAVMVVRMLDVDVSAYTDSPFSDVKSTSGAAKAIAYCADKGIIDGVGNGKFAPSSPITREAAAKIIAKALDLKGTSADKFADDAKIANWAKGFVYACKAEGIFEGDNKGNFNPKNYIKRSEAAKVMVLAMNNK